MDDLMWANAGMAILSIHTTTSIVVGIYVWRIHTLAYIHVCIDKRHNTHRIYAILTLLETRGHKNRSMTHIQQKVFFNDWMYSVDEA